VLLDLLVFAAGVVALVGGAWMLVTGGSRLAALFGVAPVVIGLTIVAFGTSAPELFVSLTAVLRGSGDLMLGNVVGSNVANIGLILGATAVVASVGIEAGLTRREIPLLLVISAIFTGLVFDGTFARWEGLVLTALFGVFMWVTLRDARRGQGDDAGGADGADGEGGRGTLGPVRPIGEQGRAEAILGLDEPKRRTRARATAIYSLLALAGIGGLTLGGNLIVTSGLNLAGRFGVSEAVIGLSLVAVGTSLPELATTLVAAARRESDIALGNIVGSNLFNILAVAGPVAVISPLSTPSAVRAPQLLTMLGFTVLLALLVRGRSSVGRLAGVFLLVIYGAVMVWWTRLGS